MLHPDDEETREGTGRDEWMRAIAKQFDDAGVEYDMPIPPSANTPDYGLSDSEFRKRVDLEWELPIMQAALATRYGCVSFLAARIPAAAVSCSHMYAPRFVFP